MDYLCPLTEKKHILKLKLDKFLDCVIFVRQIKIAKDYSLI